MPNIPTPQITTKRIQVGVKWSNHTKMNISKKSPKTIVKKNT